MKKSAFDKKWKKEVGESSSNPNSVFDRLTALATEACIARPPEAFTTAEYSRNHKPPINYHAAHSILCRLERLGKVKRMCGAQQKPSWWVLV